MFDAVSFALCGSEVLSTELRLRACIEMVLKRDNYTSLTIAKRLIWVSPNYISSVHDCASKHGFSSIWTLFALADVIGIPIQSIYLPINGIKYLSYITLNLTAIPRNCVYDTVQVIIMWTRTAYHNVKQTKHRLARAKCT